MATRGSDIGASGVRVTSYATDDAGSTLWGTCPDCRNHTRTDQENPYV